MKVVSSSPSLLRVSGASLGESDSFRTLCTKGRGGGTLCAVESDGIPLDITVLRSPVVLCKLVDIMCVLCVRAGAVSVYPRECFLECGAGANFFNMKISKDDAGTWYLVTLSSISQNNYIGGYLRHNCWCLSDLEDRAKFTEEWLESEDGELIFPSRCSAPARTGRAGRPTSKELSRL